LQHTHYLLKFINCDALQETFLLCTKLGKKLKEQEDCRRLFQDMIDQ